MTSLNRYLFPVALLAVPLLAGAQQWNRAPREVFWDGNCRVEQFLDRDGNIVERRRCRGDANAYARAAGDSYGGDLPPPVRQSPRYADLVPQPGSYAASRAAQRAEAEPAPVYRSPEPVAVIPRIEPQMEPRVVPKVAPPPVAVTTRVVAKAAPPPAVLYAPVVPPRVAASTRVAAKAPAVLYAPVVPVAAPAAPVVAPRLAHKAVPAMKAPLAKPVRPVLIAKALPAPVAPRIAHVPATAAKPPRILAKAAIAKPARPVEIAAAPAVPAPKPAAAAAAPRVVAKVEPESPKVAAKVETVGKSPGNYPKSDWLVTLPSTDQEKAEAVVKTPVASAKSTGAIKPLVAKVEPDWQRHEYREYVVEKSKDRYSNLK